MSHSLYTTEAEDYLIGSLAESYQDHKNDLHNLLDDLVARAYSRGKSVGAERAYEEIFSEDEKDKYYQLDQRRF